MRLLVCYSTLAPSSPKNRRRGEEPVVIGTTRHLLSTAKFAAELWFAIVAANRLHTGCTLGCTLCFTLQLRKTQHLSERHVRDQRTDRCNVSCVN